MNPDCCISEDDQMKILQMLDVNLLKEYKCGLFYGKPDMSNIAYIFNIILEVPIPNWIKTKYINELNKVEEEWY